MGNRGLLLTWDARDVRGVLAARGSSRLGSSRSALGGIQSRNLRAEPRAMRSRNALGEPSIQT